MLNVLNECVECALLTIKVVYTCTHMHCVQDVRSTVHIAAAVMLLRQPFPLVACH